MLRARGLDLETHAFAALEKSDDLEEIAGARVARRPQHSHEAFGRDACGFGEVRKAQGRVDVIAQDGLRRGYIAGEHLFTHTSNRALRVPRINPARIFS